MTSNYELKRTVKAGMNHYEVFHKETGKRISGRVSARDYEACTVNGSFYFGRLDLIGKGDHGRKIRELQERIANPGSGYAQYIKMLAPEGEKSPNYLTKEDYIERELSNAKADLETINTIAYLSK